MNIAAINGSPKAKSSSSGSIIAKMESITGVQIETYHAIKITQGETPPELLEGMLKSDILLIVFPLYVDSLPAPLIELLHRLERAAKARDAKPRIFAVINCGFLESKQTALALDMVRHFACRAGFAWGCGLGIGSGGMLSSLGENWEKGPAAGIYKAMKVVANAMLNGESREDALVEPNFPRWIYRLSGNMMWRSMVRRNGVRNIRARPYANRKEDWQ